MHIAHEMRRLRAEHAALATLAHFLREMVGRQTPPRPTELASVRGMLRDTLVRHLKCEDWVLYPRLQTSGDPVLIDLARDFVDEMGHFAEDFIAYDARWTGERVEQEWDAFRSETRLILDALAARTAREENELYPAVEAFDDAPSSAPTLRPARGGLPISA